MQFLNNYTLECSGNSNVKKYSLISSITPFFKLFAIISLVGLFWSLYSLIVFWVLWLSGMVLNFYKNKLVFTYKYSIFGQKLVVFKEDLLFKKQILADIDLVDIEKCTISEVISKDIPKYYDKNFENGFIVTITTKNSNFAIICDEYMYSVLSYNLKIEKEILEL